MATYLWSSLTNGQVLAFDPASDILNFDDAGISAAGVAIDYGSPAQSVFTYAGKTVTLLAAPKSLSTTHVTFANGSVLVIGDNSTATANDDLANSFTGGAGNDHLIGLGGADTLLGGAGNDLLDGGAGEDRLQGGDGNDSAVGGAGNDLFDWTSSQRGGVDTMWGGVGDDQFNLSSGDLVVEFNGEGTDTAWVDFAGLYSLGSNVENLTLWGAATGVNGRGNSLNNVIVGNDAANTLEGADGNDSLVGAGGNDLFDWVGSMRGGVDTMSGGAGDDQYNLSAGDVVVEFSGEGVDTAWVDFDGYVLPANVENLTLYGSANISGTGNNLNNVITGNTGNNTLDGGPGNDTLIGVMGDDVLIYDPADGKVEGRIGTDILRLNGSGTHIDLTAIPDSVLLDLEVIDLNTGGGTNNTLTLSVADLLAFSSETDTLRVDGNAGDVVNAVDGPWTFTGNVVIGAQTYGQFTLGAAVLQVDTDITSGFDQYQPGTGGDDFLAGGSGNDSLAGGAGNDTLDAGAGNDTLDGGTGSDSMAGGAGDDLYLLDSAGDAVLEFAASGTDMLISSVTVAALPANVEGVELAGGGAIDATGNGADNVLAGNSGNNTLNGAGGNDSMMGGAGDDLFDWISSLRGGTDTMRGGAGDDQYNLSSGDLIVEDPGEGTDTAWVDFGGYVLPVNVENLTLWGAGAIGGTGNTHANFITGNGAANAMNGAAGNDTLDGGAGDDTMSGSIGDDVYLVHSATDVVLENPGEGIDTVRSLTPLFTLPDEIENAVCAYSGGGGMTGNAMSNFMSGNDLVNTLEGAGGNDTLDGGAGGDSMVGGVGGDSMVGGTGGDFYFVDDVSDIVVETSNDPGALLAPGALLIGGAALEDIIDTVVAAVNYTLDQIQFVENLILDGAATTGTGNELDNTIVGNELDNTLSGLAGLDTLDGGAGHDTIHGGDGDDSLIGGAGNDRFDWTSSLRGGVDTMRGGAGDDQFNLSAGDVVTEFSGDGTDTVWVDFVGTYLLPVNVENLTLWGSATGVNGRGNAANNVIFGNAQANTLDGGDGNDSLVGGAGNDLFDWTSSLRGGTDTMSGGAGDDQFSLSAGDVVQEFAGEGTDRVWVDFAGTYVLGANLENLTLWGNAVGVNGTGNSAVNVIFGNTQANTLNGADGNDTMNGGAGNDLFDWTSSLRGGNDWMYGRQGDDQFNIDAGDVVQEFFGEGTDTVWVDFGGTYILGPTLENLTLWGAATGINGRGNAVNNVITGNGQANTLEGAGGNDTLVGGAGNDLFDWTSSLRTGTDSMVGGAGDDQFNLSSGDVVVESVGQGTDTVWADFTGYTLPVNVENLTLWGAAAISGTGNGENNTLTGNSAANTLKGGGGNDSLKGAGGADVFLFDEAPSPDTILDFTTGVDHIHLDNAIFTAFAATGAVSAQNVQVAAQASINATSGNAGDGQDFLKYGSDTGNLYYDADGTGGGALQLVATVYSSGTTAAVLAFSPAQDVVIV